MRLVQFVGQSLYPRIQILDIHATQIGNVAIIDIVTASLKTKAVAMTIGTYRAREKLLAPMTRRSPGLFVLLHLDILDNSLIGRKVVRGGHCLIGDGEMLGGAVEYIVNAVFAQLANRRAQVKAITPANSLYLPKYHRIMIFTQW